VLFPLAITPREEEGEGEEEEEEKEVAEEMVDAEEEEEAFDEDVRTFSKGRGTRTFPRGSETDARLFLLFCDAVVDTAAVARAGAPAEDAVAKTPCDEAYVASFTASLTWTCVCFQNVES
jgi:hypothetical protein